TAYSWNSDNRLIKVEHTGQNNKTIQYGYDPQGRRIKKLVTQGTSKTETHYSLDSERPYHEVVVESTRVNTQPWTHKTYVHTPGGVGELISQSDGTTTKQIYADAQGTTRLITGGNTSQSYSFDAFGNWLEGDAISPNSNPPTHLYTGERYDADTGLIYLRARDYDPSIGRFISMDEHPGDQRIPLTLNKYLYANADPVNFIDPSGYLTVAFGAPGISLSINISMATISIGARVVVKKVVVPLVMAGAAIALNHYVKSEQERRDALDAIRDAIIAKAAVDASKLLFHYTGHIAADEIFFTQSMFVSKGYSHGDGIYRPRGAYATEIQPWLYGASQRLVREILYDRPRNQDVSAFVVLKKDPGWRHVASTEWYKSVIFGNPVPVIAIMRASTPFE
ncbi:RHS repeat-associated core domain-containing protein, partial [Vandammella animalimorsus]